MTRRIWSSSVLFNVEAELVASRCPRQVASCSGSACCSINNSSVENKSLLVIGAAEVHPVSSRTRPLSPSAPMVLGGRPPGRVGHCQGAFVFSRQYQSRESSASKWTVVRPAYTMCRSFILLALLGWTGKRSANRANNANGPKTFARIGVIRG